MTQSTITALRLAAEAHGDSATGDLLREAADALTATELERDTAIRLLANWCVSVQDNGSGWDDWDEEYKNAAYRENRVTLLLNKAIDQERITRKAWK